MRCFKWYELLYLVVTVSVAELTLVVGGVVIAFAIMGRL